MAKSIMRIPKSSFDGFVPPSGLSFVEKNQNGVILASRDKAVRIDFIRDDVLRLKISSKGAMDYSPTHAVINDKISPVTFELKNHEKCLVLTAKEMEVRIRLDLFSIDIYRSDRSEVFTSLDSKAYLTSGDKWAIIRNKKVKDLFLGFGQRTGPMNQNGRYLQMWNFNIWHLDKNYQGRSVDNFNTKQDPYYISVPFFYRLDGDNPELASGSFVDNGYRLHYDFHDPNTYSIVGDGGQLTEYIFAGPSLRGILERYTELTGRMETPPLWSLGYHQSRWAPYSTKDFMAIAETCRKRYLPCDAIWFDIDYMDHFKIFTWDRKKIPSPEKLIEEMRRRGFHSICNINPCAKIEPGYRVFDQGVERGLFCKTADGKLFIDRMWGNEVVFFDFSNEEVRSYWEKLIAEQAVLGLDGAWLDMNEPSIALADENCMLFQNNGMTHEHARFHNQYALLEAASTHAALKNARPDKRSFIISRSGFAGIQRYAAVWTGDNASRWEHLRMSLTMCCNLGMSGIPFVGSDIGGFVEDCTEELLIRWYQYAVFQPLCRNHSAWKTKEHFPWSFGEHTESLIRKSLNMRYSLLPYIYTTFVLSSETGEPVQRPLAFDFQQDSRCVPVEDQFMFGGQIMAAPVLEDGARKRRVIFPEGRWYAFGSDQWFEGGKSLWVDAPLDWNPAFVKAGAVIPTARPVQSTADYRPEEIYLNVYLPDEEGEWISWLVEDDGESLDYLGGGCLRTRVILSHRDGRVTLAGETVGKVFSNFKRRWFTIKIFGREKQEIKLKNSGGNFTMMLPVNQK
jgi:alpha-glucosidase